MRTQLKRQDAVSLSARLAMQFPGDEQVIESLSLAAFAHDGAFRKETRNGAEYMDPYIIHPLRNALRVQRWYAGWHYPHVPAMVCAALLHDTVEDAAERILDFYGDTFLLYGNTPRETALNALARRFGEEIAGTVMRLTNPESDTGTSYTEHIAAWVVSDEMAFVAKASDLVDNAGSLKHMDASPRRDKLVRKYMDPVQFMVTHANVVKVPHVRKRVIDRLNGVAVSLRAITESDGSVSLGG